MADGLTVDGVSIQTYAYNVKNRGGRFRTPERRGSNAILPGIHGRTYVQGKPFDENVLPLTMWALGCETDGSMPSDGKRALQVRENLDALTRMFQPGRLVALQQTVDTTIRECWGEVVQAIDFTTMAGGTRAEFAVEIRVPGAFWRDTASTNQTVLTGTGDDVTISFSTFGPSTAPLTGMQFDVLGPVTDPILTDPVTGQWVKHTGGVPGSQHLIVDAAAWTATLNGANAIANITHGNGATFLDLSPRSAGPQVRVQGTGKNSSTSVKVTGKNSYLLA